MNGFQLATRACCRSDNSATFPPLALVLHAWLRLPALISNLFMKREAAFQHGSRNLRKGGERKALRQEHREAKIALAAEKEAESSDAYKHEIKGAVLQRLLNPLRPEGERKL